MSGRLPPLQHAAGLTLEQAGPAVDRALQGLPFTIDAAKTAEQLNLALSRGVPIVAGAAGRTVEVAADFAQLSPSEQWRRVIAARDGAVRAVGTIGDEGQEIIAQIKENPVGQQALSVAAGVIEEFGFKDFLKGFEAAQKGNVVDALKHIGMGGLNLLGELSGIKDLFMRFPDAVSRGDFVGAGLSLASGLFSIATFGAGSLLTATAKTALKSFLQTGAKEAFEVFAKETAEQVGKYLASDAAKTLGKDSLRQVVTEGYEAAGKEAAERVAQEVAKLGATQVTEESVKKFASEATEKATKKLLEDLGVDKLISDLVERRLQSIADNKAISGTGKKLADDLRSLGVDEKKIQQMVMGARAQFKSAGNAGVYGQKFDDELIKIYTEAITKEVKEQLLGAGAKGSFQRGFESSLQQEMKKLGVTVDEATMVIWKRAAGEGFEEGLEKGVRETVERAVREGFDRFRKRGDRDDSPSSSIRPPRRNIIPGSVAETSAPLGDIPAGGLEVGGVSFGDIFAAFKDESLQAKLARLDKQETSNARARSGVTATSRPTERSSQPTMTPGAPTTSASEASIGGTNGSNSTDLG